jgi:hypothetical protein
MYDMKPNITVEPLQLLPHICEVASSVLDPEAGFPGATTAFFISSNIYYNNTLKLNMTSSSYISPNSSFTIFLSFNAILSNN